jgi:hypothetical protein
MESDGGPSIGLDQRPPLTGRQFRRARLIGNSSTLVPAMPAHRIRKMCNDHDGTEYRSDQRKR